MVINHRAVSHYNTTAVIHIGYLLVLYWLFTCFLKAICFPRVRVLIVWGVVAHPTKATYLSKVLILYLDRVFGCRIYDPYKSNNQ